ncbi:MAG: DegV family protein [Slackia piriformis]|uniref:DegV family protein n=1 Tax=Slackia piriformis TaxID=626934 RepID=A0A943UYC5_9ACTN|nr:DegV family protein [Slackia piriformis]
MKIAIVTDSTCDWPYADYARRDVSMVPLSIGVEGRALLDQVELSNERFCDLLESSAELPTTSQPSPGAFSRVFDDLAARGYDAALCLHIGSSLSGTVQSASIAASQAPIEVRVVDTRLAASALGIVVDAACRLRDSGVDDLDALERLVVETCGKTSILLVPETLDALVRGGRLPKEAAEKMGMLNVRALLTIDEQGSVVFFDKARGAKGALARCIEVLEQRSGLYGPLDVRYAHVRNQGAADAAAAAIGASGADVASLHADVCGATIATHLGLGAWCIAMAPRVG